MEGIKIDATSLLVGASAGCAAGALLGYILARRSFNAKLAVELDAAKHHYQLRAEAARARDNAIERPASTMDDGNYEHAGDDGVVRDFYGNPVDHAGHIKASEDKLMADLERTPFDPEDPRLEGCEDEPGDEEPDSDDDSGVAWTPPIRDRAKPYLISAAEFAQGPEDDGRVHQCISIRWYDADKVLVDDREGTIPDIRRTTGSLTRDNFGGISGDPNIAYIRNERLEVDFEVRFDERAYTDAVLNYGNPSNRARK